MPRQYKLARKMKKIALTAAAKEMGIAQSTLSGWESERTIPSIEGLERMADYYRVSTDFLLGRTRQDDPLSLIHILPQKVPEPLHQKDGVLLRCSFCWKHQYLLRSCSTLLKSICNGRRPSFPIADSICLLTRTLGLNLHKSNAANGRMAD